MTSAFYKNKNTNQYALQLQYFSDNPRNVTVSIQSYTSLMKRLSYWWVTAVTRPEFFIYIKMPIMLVNDIWENNINSWKVLDIVCVSCISRSSYWPQVHMYNNAFSVQITYTSLIDILFSVYFRIIGFWSYICVYCEVFSFNNMYDLKT